MNFRSCHSFRTERKNERETETFIELIFCWWKAFSASFKFSCSLDSYVAYANFGSIWAQKIRISSLYYSAFESKSARQYSRLFSSTQWSPCDLNSKYEMNEANRIWKTSRTECIYIFVCERKCLCSYTLICVCGFPFTRSIILLAAFKYNFIRLSNWNAFLCFFSLSIVRIVYSFCF